MIKSVPRSVLAFDVEWVPDPVAGRLLLDLPDDTPPESVLEAMWRYGGATEENPSPYLKTVLCRIVSLAAVWRRTKPDGEVNLSLLSRPRMTAIDEAAPDGTIERTRIVVDRGDAAERSVVGHFLEWLGKTEPQLVGFNSVEADLKILLQRAIVLGIRADGFARRPNKPWEGRDYFHRDNDWNCDLKQMLGGFGKATPALHEIAIQCGIPGKFGIDGSQVAELWLAGGLDRIVAYNECDALTTYLLWLRVAHFAGHFTTEQYAAEQERVRDLLRSEGQVPSRAHLGAYLREWDRLSERIAVWRPD